MTDFSDLWQPLPTGTVLRSRYEIVSLLGKGGFGATYRARDRGRGHVDSVVKELLPKHGDNPDVRRMFEREARVLQTLRCPGIPALQAYFSTAERHYLVQDFVDGVTLEHELQRRGSLPEREIVDILGQVLHILAYLQALTPPVIHRDIKPANIMRGPDGRVSLLDFGAVKEALGQAQIETAETMDLYRESVVVYSKGYAAPEQLRGVVAPASDLYALGATALHLISGRAPQRWYDALAGEWRFRGQLALGPRLESVLTRLLEEQVARRFRNAEQVLDALRDHPANAELVTSVLRAGATLADRYIIEAVIDQHLDETVYRARDREALNRLCIVRAFVPEGGNSPSARTAFENEGRALAAISHPAIPRLGAFFVDGSSYYTVEEMIEGQPVAESVQPGARLSQTAIAHALRGTLEALAHLHQQSPPIVHRAVHPAHLIRASNGRVFLTGFGGLREAVLGRGRAMGYTARSEAYEPPGSSARPAEPADDLYALGATGVYWFTAEPPRAGSSDVGQIPGLDSRFRTFLEQLLGQSPATRFASARDALAEFTSLGLKEGVAGDDTRYEERKARSYGDASSWAASLPAWLSKKAALTIGVAAAVAIAWWMKPEPGPPPPPPVPISAPAPPAPVLPVPAPAAPQPVPQERVLYANDLWNQRTFPAGQNGGCAWGYADGGFVLGHFRSQGWCFFNINEGYRGTVRIEVSARLRSGALNYGFGLKFGAPSRDNSEYYFYEIAANGGHKLAYYRDGQWNALYDWKNDGAVRQGYGALNRLAVETHGATILTSLNGRQVGSARAPGEVRGYVGFLVWHTGMEAVFSDLRVLGLPDS